MYITFNFNSVDKILSLADFVLSVYLIYLLVRNHRELIAHENRWRNDYDEIKRDIERIENPTNEPDQNRIPGHPNPPPPPTK